MLIVEAEALRDPARATSLEWIETNGLGGWASSSICFANTRRYHGMLVTASRTGAERTVVVSKLDETLNGVELATNFYPGVVHPRGFEHLTRFERGAFPVWEFAIGRARLRKTLVCPRGENTTIIRYEIFDDSAELRLRPFLAGRDYHSLMRSRDGSPPRVGMYVPGARFEAAPDWFYNFEYPRERERGLDFLEDLFTPGESIVRIEPGTPLDVVLSVEENYGAPVSAGHENDRLKPVLHLFERERARRERFDVFALAADQFIIDRGHHDLGIVAGYHWFAEWGRDSMISLPGLCLATGRYGDAKRILRRWLGAMRDGRLPNRFVEYGEPEFNSIDATLWLFVAIWRYVDATGDHRFVREEAMPKLVEAIDSYRRDVSGGLLHSPAQATWMDARVNGIAITPRAGAAVEVNALWYNALRIAAALNDDPSLLVSADETREAFRARFWNERSGCCFDVVDPEDSSIRPNQLLPISLPFPLLAGERAESVLRVCEEKLMTPVGPRTLAFDDPRYRGRLEGGPFERDSAYHQGTVWPWLLGPWITALARVRGEAGRAEGRRLIANMQQHLADAAVGTIPECYDGDPPHAARGCIAQAWSVAELLRVMSEELDGREKDRANQRLAHS